MCQPPEQIKALGTSGSITNLSLVMRISYLSPKTEVRESNISGLGLFAITDITKDEIAAVKGGRIVDRKTLREKITPRFGSVEIQIDNNLFIAPGTPEERQGSMLYSITPATRTWACAARSRLWPCATFVPAKS